jgi:hypothetical protein
MAQSSSALPPHAPAWKQLYESAILELDKNKLPDRIAEARRAIHDRAEEIMTSASLAEHRALNQALSSLRILEEVSARENSAA